MYCTMGGAGAAANRLPSWLSSCAICKFHAKSVGLRFGRPDAIYRRLFARISVALALELLYSTSFLFLFHKNVMIDDFLHSGEISSLFAATLLVRRISA